MMLADMVQFPVQVLDNQGSFKKRRETKCKKCKKRSFGAEMKPNLGNHQILEIYEKSFSHKKAQDIAKRKLTRA